jgi:hypothetical protein
LDAQLLIEQHPFRLGKKRYVRAVDIAAEIVFLLGDDNSETMRPDEWPQELNQEIPEQVVLRVVACHVYQFSVHKLMIAREIVGEFFEIVNRQSGHCRHNSYCIRL